MTTYALARNQVMGAVRVVQTTNLAGTYFNGNTNNGVGATLTKTTAGALTIDSVAVVNNDRVLLAGQTNANENGIYVVVNAGSAGVAWQLQRANDLQCAEQLGLGYFVPVYAGTANAGSLYQIIEPLPANFGIDNLVFVSASAAGSGLYLESANNLSDVASKLTSLTNLGIKRGTTTAYGGGGTSNAFTATGLLSTDIVVATILASTNSVAVTKAVPTTNTLTITFSADPGAGTTVQWHAIATV